MTGKDQHIPSEQELRQWVHSTSQGDQHSFTLLLRNYWNKVYSQAFAYLKSSEKARELTQDVFVKLWFARQKLAGVENFSDYLFILSRNEIISTLRRKNEQLELPPDELEEVFMRPDRQLHYKESYGEILRLIEQLPPARKKVFVMSRLEGKSYEEIGSELGISRNGVKDHIIKALSYLRAHFAPHSAKGLILILVSGALIVIY